LVNITAHIDRDNLRRASHEH